MAYKNFKFETDADGIAQDTFVQAYTSLARFEARLPSDAAVVDGLSFGKSMAWGAEGTTIPNLGSAPLMMQFETKAAYYYVALALLALGLVITYVIERSWMGYYLVAIGEDEDAAEAIVVSSSQKQ